MIEGCLVVCNFSPLVENDERIEACFQAIEDALSDVKIDHVIASADYTWLHAKDRGGLLSDRQISGPKGASGHSITIFGNGRRDAKMVSVTFGKSSKDSLLDADVIERRMPGPRKFDLRKTWTCRVSISNQLPETLALLPKLLASICEATGAIDGYADSGVALGQAQNDTARVVADGHLLPPTRTLQSDEPKYGICKRPLIGQMKDGFRFYLSLNWINYWSDAVAQALGFPNRALDGPLEGLFWRINNQGWLVQLTKDAMNLDVPDHLERLNWAYSRFCRDCS